MLRYGTFLPLFIHNFMVCFHCAVLVVYPYIPLIGVFFVTALLLVFKVLGTVLIDEDYGNERQEKGHFKYKPIVGFSESIDWFLET